MQIPVILERIGRNGYRARGAEPFAVSAKGATREEAVAKLRAKIEGKLKNGRELIALDVGAPPPHPWMRFAGMFKDDPMFDDWQKAIAEYRNEVEADPNYL